MEVVDDENTDVARSGIVLVVRQGLLTTVAKPHTTFTCVRSKRRRCSCVQVGSEGLGVRSLVGDIERGSRFAGSYFDWAWVIR